MSNLPPMLKRLAIGGIVEYARDFRHTRMSENIYPILSPALAQVVGESGEFVGTLPAADGIAVTAGINRHRWVCVYFGR